MLGIHQQVAKIQGLYHYSLCEILNSFAEIKLLKNLDGNGLIEKKKDIKQPFQIL